MTDSPSLRGDPRRLAELLSLACMAAGACGWAWELLALQSPSSPWNVPGFPTAIARFAAHAWITGLAVHAVTRDLTPPRWAVVVAAVGAALSLGAQGASAATGLLGVQVRDARAGGLWVLAARVSGGALLAVAFVTVASLRLRRR